MPIYENITSYFYNAEFIPVAVEKIFKNFFGIDPSVVYLRSEAHCSNISQYIGLLENSFEAVLADQTDEFENVHRIIDLKDNNGVSIVFYLLAGFSKVSDNFSKGLLGHYVLSMEENRFIDFVEEVNANNNFKLHEAALTFEVDSILEKMYPLGGEYRMDALRFYCLKGDSPKFVEAIARCERYEDNYLNYRSEDSSLLECAFKGGNPGIVESLLPFGLHDDMRDQEKDLLINTICREVVSPDYCVTLCNKVMRRAESIIDEEIFRKFIINDRFDVVSFLFNKLHNYLDLNSLIHIANGNQGEPKSYNRKRIINFLAGHRENFGSFCNTLKDLILSKVDAYVNRSNNENQLLALAREDGRNEPYGNTNQDKQNRDLRAFRFLEILLNYFNDVRKPFRIYHGLVSHGQMDFQAFYDGFSLYNRQEIVQHVKNQPDQNDSMIVKNHINEALHASLNTYLTNFGAQDEIEEGEQVEMHQILGRSVANGMISKKSYFVERFANQFDQLYLFYMAMNSPEFERVQDEAGNLDDIARRILENAPSIPINLATIFTGIPIPLPGSFNLPTGAAILAIIDLCKYVKERGAENRANRIADFFKRLTLRQRTQLIYFFAETVAGRFEEQINVLHAGQSGIDLFAELAVARIFTYIGKRDANIIEKQGSNVEAFFRKFSRALGINTGPQTQILYYSFADICIKAVSEFKYEWSWGGRDPEQELLALEQEFVDMRQNRQITAKAIFECMAIKTMIGQCFARNEEDPVAVGYIHSNLKEAQDRGLHELQEYIPAWFERVPENALNPHNFFSLGQQGFGEQEEVKLDNNGHHVHAP